MAVDRFGDYAVDLQNTSGDLYSFIINKSLLRPWVSFVFLASVLTVLRGAESDA